MADDEKPSEKAMRRIVRFLAQGAAEPSPGVRPGSVLLDGGARGTVSVEAAALACVAAHGLVRRSGKMLELTHAGASLVRHADLSGDRFQLQHREMEHMEIEGGDGPVTMAVNAAESPLALLFRRKARNGAPFLSEAQFRAGERLRSDFTRGQLMPRLGANWESAVASGRRDAGNGIADLQDAAIAARQRVDRALDAVGPELAGLLVDICCFLKGLERVEMERGWPVRSAKVVLKTALAALQRHYEPPPAGPQRRVPSVLHWGTADYRPRAGSS